MHSDCRREDEEEVLFEEEEVIAVVDLGVVGEAEDVVDREEVDPLLRKERTMEHSWQRNSNKCGSAMRLTRS